MHEEKITMLFAVSVLAILLGLVFDQEVLMHISIATSFLALVVLSAYNITKR